MIDPRALQKAWDELDIERKRLEIEQERLALGRETLEVERKRHLRAVKTEARANAKEKFEMEQQNTRLQEELNFFKKKYDKEKAFRLESAKENANNNEEINRLHHLYEQEKEKNMMQAMDLKLKLSKHEMDLDDTRKEVLKSVEDYTSVKEKFQELQQKYDSLLQQRESNHAHKSTKHASKKKIGKIELHVDSLKKQVSELTSEKEMLISDLDVSKAKIGQFDLEVHALRSENLECTRQLLDLKEKCNDLIKESLRLRVIVQEKENYAAQAMARIKDYNEIQLQFQELKEKYESLLQIIEKERESKFSEKESSSDELELEVDVLKDHVLALTSEIESLTLNLDNVNKIAEDRDARASALSLEKENLLSTIHELEEKVQNLVQAQDISATQISSSSKENALHIGAINKLKEEYKDLKTICISFEEKIRLYEEKLVTLEEENKSYISQLQDNRKTIDEMQVELTENMDYKNEISMLRKENEMHLFKMSELTEEMKELKATAGSNQQASDIKQNLLTQNGNSKDDQSRSLQDKRNGALSGEDEFVILSDGSEDDDESDDDLYLPSDNIARECPKCEDYEEKIYNLKVRLNKIEMEHQKEIQELKEKMQGFKEAEKSEVKHSSNQSHRAAKESDRSLLELQLEESIAKINELTLEMQKLQQEVINFGHERQRNLEQVEGLERQVHMLQHSEENLLALQAKNEEEWNTWIDSLSQKQKHFVEILPYLDSKVKSIEMRIDELYKVELSVSNKSSNSVHEERTGKKSYRKPPLTREDSQQNRHVTEYNLEAEGERGKYTGFLNSMNLPECHGIFRLENEDVYEGEWKDGKQHGIGVYIWCHGDLYHGPWSEGKQHGHGVYLYSDGSIYDGEYHIGKREGVGMFVRPNGSRYEGSFKCNERCGKGMFVYPDGRVYTGDYLHDKPHGYGVEKSKDGEVLRDGNWQCGAFVPHFDDDESLYQPE
jgi:hypothetical protein